MLSISCIVADFNFIFRKEFLKAFNNKYIGLFVSSSSLLPLSSLPLSSSSLQIFSQPVTQNIH
jgi:hypothetical protein